MMVMVKMMMMMKMMMKMIDDDEDDDDDEGQRKISSPRPAVQSERALSEALWEISSMETDVLENSVIVYNDEPARKRRITDYTEKRRDQG